MPMPSGNPSTEPWRTQATAPTTSSGPTPGTSKRKVDVLADGERRRVSRKMPPFDRLIE